MVPVNIISAIMNPQSKDTSADTRNQQILDEARAAGLDTSQYEEASKSKGLFEWFNEDLLGLNYESRDERAALQALGQASLYDANPLANTVVKYVDQITGNLTQGAGSTVANIKDAGLDLVDKITGNYDSEASKTRHDETANYWNNYANTQYASVDENDKALKWVADAANAVGSEAPILLASTLATAINPIAGTAVNAGLHGMRDYSQNRQAGYDELGALGRAGISAGIEALGSKWLPGGKAVKGLAGTIMRGAIGEAVESIEDYAVGAFLGEHDFNVKDMLRGASIEGFTGGLFGGGVHVGTNIATNIENSGVRNQANNAVKEAKSDLKQYKKAKSDSDLRDALILEGVTFNSDTETDLKNKVNQAVQNQNDVKNNIKQAVNSRVNTTLTSVGIGQPSLPGGIPNLPNINGSQYGLMLQSNHGSGAKSGATYDWYLR